MEQGTEKLEGLVSRVRERLEREGTATTLRPEAVAKFMEETGKTGAFIKRLDRIVETALPAGDAASTFHFGRSATQAPGDLTWSAKTTEDAVRKAAEGTPTLVEANTWCHLLRSSDEGKLAVMVSARARMTKTGQHWGLVVRAGWRNDTEGVGPGYWDQESGTPHGNSRNDYAPPVLTLDSQDEKGVRDAIVRHLEEALKHVAGR